MGWKGGLGWMLGWIQAVLRLAVGRGEGRGWSAREERGGMGQEVVKSWRTVEKAIKRSHSPRHAQRAGA